MEVGEFAARLEQAVAAMDLARGVHQQVDDRGMEPVARGDHRGRADQP